MRRIYDRYFLVAFVSLISVLIAENTTGQINIVDLEEQIDNSSTVIEGEVINSYSFWDETNSNIYTAFQINVFKSFKGLEDEEIEVIVPGGTVGLDRHEVSHTLSLRTGEVVVLSLRDIVMDVIGSGDLARYESTAGPQSAIRLDEQSAEVRGYFNDFNTADDLYSQIEQIVGQEYAEIERYDFDSISGYAQRMPITTFNPTSTTAGTESLLTISGSGFGATQGTVYFSNADDGGATFIAALDTEVQSWNDTQVTVYVPGDAGTGPIAVETDGGGSFFQSSGDLTIDYAVINLTSDAVSAGTFVAYGTQHVDDNANGGYTWQMFTDFDADAGANAAFVRALDTWRCQSGVDWEIGATTGVDVISSDGVNVVRFDNGGELPGGVLGRCTSRFSGCFISGGTDIDWYVTELDIAFDDGTAWHYTREETPFTDYDFESVAVHELGHGYQQGHVIDPTDIMHYAIANGTFLRQPSTNNLAGTGYIQNLSTTTSVCGESSAGTYACPSTTIVINEVDADQTGTDSDEFVELFGPASTSLDGMVLVFFNGSGDLSIDAYDLDGRSTDGNGYFVLGSATVPNVDFTPAGFTTNAIQNGADAVALYFGDASDWPNGSILYETNLIDALVYDTDDGDDAGLLALMLPGEAQINENGNGNKDIESNSRFPDGGNARESSTYVQQTPTPGEANALPGCAPDNDPPVLSAGCGTEDASTASYGDGWQTGDGDGSAFGTWTLATTSGDGGQNGHFTGNSATNGGGDGNGDGDIGDPSWAMYANSGQTASAVLPFAQTMQPGSTFEINMDNGFIDGGSSVGFGIQNASNENLWEFFFQGGQPNYIVNASGGTTSTSLGFSDEGLTIEISMTSATTFDVTVTLLEGGAQWTSTSTLIAPGGGQIPAQLRVFNFSAGGGGTNNAFFNNIELCHPCPDDIAVACADFENTGITGAPVVTDVCDPSPTLTFSDVLGACSSQQFTVTRTFTGEDVSTNQATCQQILTVTDNVVPTATCQNINVALTGGTATILPADVDNGSLDGCSSISLSLDIDTFDCTDIPSSPNTVTLTVTDDCGNQNTCTSDVTITSAAITAIADAGGQTACQSPENTYENDVTVTYLNAPGSGSLDINGQLFAITGSPQTETLVGLTADGAPVDVTAQFTADSNCPFTADDLFTSPAPCTPFTSIVINEVDADQPSIDGDEFVELFGSPNESLDGMVLVFYNGGGTDATYAAYDLDGFSLNANGFFVVGAASVPNVDYTPTGWTTNEIQNGADAVALFFGNDSDFPNGTGVTTTNIIDAVVYDTNDADDAELLALLNGGQPQVDENGFTGSEIDSNSRVPDGGDQQDTDTYVQQIPTPGVTNILPAGCSPDATAPVLTDACATEDTDGSSYNDGWQNGDGDASLFGTWSLTTSNGNPSNAGHFLGSSTGNGDGDGNTDGDIDVGGEAWGLYGNSSETSSAIITFDEALDLGDRLSTDMDNGFVDAFSVVGIGLQNASGENLWEFFFRGGEASYEVNENSGSVFTGLGFTDEGLTVEIEITGSNTLDYTITRLDGGGTFSGSSTTITQAGGQAPAQIRLFNFNAGLGASNNAFFNSLELCHACPSDLSVLCTTDIQDTTITGAPIVQDVCDISPTLSWSDVEGSCSGGSYDVIRTFTGTDGSGNQSTCAQTITVTDNVAPTIVCNSTLDITLDGSGNYTLTPEEVDNGSSDTCGDLSLSLDRTEFDCSDVSNSPITVTLTVTDDCGNSGTCTSEVTVLDPGTCPPVNDDCENAIVQIPVLFGTPGWDTLSIANATQTFSGCSGVANDDVWFSFTAGDPNDVIIAQDPNGLNDVIIQVFDACAGTSLGCFDNYSGSGSMERALPGGLTVGADYFYRVYDAAAGTPASSELRTQVKTWADGMIRDIYCGITDYSVEDYITPERQDLNQLYPFTPVVAKGYGIRLIDPIAEDTLSLSKIGYASQYFQLSELNPEYNTVYDGSARHRLRLNANGSLGFYWSDWGPACDIGIGGVQQTAIRDVFCDNVTGYNLDQIIQADFVQNATAYRFTFVDGPNTFIETNSSYGVFLYELEGLELGTSYSVTVQALVDGQWSSPGDACIINMASEPEATEVRAQYCDGTYEYPDPNFILAEYVYGATAYQWSFTPQGGGDELTEITNGITMAFHITSLPLEAGITYDVKVKAFVGGLEGPYGSTCSITMQNPTSMAEPDESDTELFKTSNMESMEMLLYPNPNDGTEFLISIESLEIEEGLAQIVIFDMLGRPLHRESRSVKGKSNTLLIKPDVDLPSGLYIVELRLGDSVSMSTMTVD